LEQLADQFDDGVVTPEALVAAGAVRKGDFVKVLGRGELSRKLDVHAHAVSKSAESAITGAGGTVTLVPLPFTGENKAGRPAAKGNQFTNR
jgi:large subunit ribosomal protein L15